MLHINKLRQDNPVNSRLLISLSEEKQSYEEKKLKSSKMLHLSVD